MKKLIVLLFGLAVYGAVAAEFGPCRVRGIASEGAWIVSNTGEIVQADDEGRFEIVLPLPGNYCLKAIKDGRDEVVRPWLRVPTDETIILPMWGRPDAKRRVVRGNVGHPAQLLITDGGQPVRGFDLAGTPIGGLNPPPGAWHVKNPYFWTSGEYCFTATGEVKIVETLDFPELRRMGWYKGDFHAHVSHGEYFYRVNLQQMNFFCRAEHYDWIWLSGDHANDEFPVDNEALCRHLSDDRLYIRLNNEFPKNIYGHFGNIGVRPMTTDSFGPGYDMEKVTNLELAEKTVYADGGLCIPVHPLYDDVVRINPKTGRKMYGMINNELLLWLLCRPELVPVIDFFYFPEERAEKFWYRLLNRGYTLACSGSSDSAVDVGRTPGFCHATYAKLDKVDDVNILKAFREGRTMVSYYGAGVVLDIDGKTSGDKLLPGPAVRHLRVDAYADPGDSFTLQVIRNGDVFVERTFTAPADGHVVLERDFAETSNAWYVAVLREAGGRGPRAIASPVYFRGPDFRPPEVIPFPKPLPANIKERLLYLTPPETDTDAWYDELKGLLKGAAKQGLASE